MEFVRSQKSRSIPDSASTSEHPEDKGSKENFSLGNRSTESDFSSAAVLSQKHQEVEMEGVEEEEEEMSPPAVVTGMTDPKQILFNLLHCQLLLIFAAGGKNKSTSPLVGSFGLEKL